MKALTITTISEVLCYWHRILSPRPRNGGRSSSMRESRVAKVTFWILFEKHVMIDHAELLGGSQDVSI